MFAQSDLKFISPFVPSKLGLLAGAYGFSQEAKPSGGGEGACRAAAALVFCGR